MKSNCYSYQLHHYPDFVSKFALFFCLFRPAHPEGIIFRHLSFCISNICVFVSLQQIYFAFSFSYYVPFSCRSISFFFCDMLVQHQRKASRAFLATIACSEIELYSLHHKRFALCVSNIYVSLLAIFCLCRTLSF